jgi:hypothetical protein
MYVPLRAELRCHVLRRWLHHSMRTVTRLAGSVAANTRLVCSSHDLLMTGRRKPCAAPAVPHFFRRPTLLLRLSRAPLEANIARHARCTRTPK